MSSGSASVRSSYGSAHKYHEFAVIELGLAVFDIVCASIADNRKFLPAAILMLRSVSSRNISNCCSANNDKTLPFNKSAAVIGVLMAVSLTKASFE
ncbi:hypothetical protein [Candidatus Methylobacter favarea]|uniref:hypothetical protein n=1 Tax=Candidatus Methylobacter favarea TaxID=2707345 RepID=UPI001C2D088C|nr:hypothetical protein [Candidatus Methylobacter favarea]